jgi:hypothetical protein
VLARNATLIALIVVCFARLVRQPGRLPAGAAAPSVDATT